MTRDVMSHAVCAALIAVALCACSNGHDACAVNGECPSSSMCRAGSCVVLAPPGCFAGDATTPDELANHCTGAQFSHFDNCDRLALCDPAALTAAFGKTVAHDSPGSPPVATVPRPTVNCADGSPNVVYVTGSQEFAPLVRAAQHQLDRGTPGYRAVFAPRTSCVGAAAILDPSPAKHVITNSPDAWAYYFDTSDNQVNCLLHDAGDTVDVGESDVDPTICGYGPTADVFLYNGPVLTASFVVPGASHATAISAEAAHLVFATGSVGGPRGPVAPWTDPNSYFVGGPDIRQLVSPAIGVDPAHWWGVARWIDRAPAPIGDPESQIGVRSVAVLDKQRGAFIPLAFQARGQLAAFLPDSTSTAFDKVNVRDGHYPLWSAVRLMTAATGNTVSAGAKAFVTPLVGPLPDIGLLGDAIHAGFVPQCAMKVGRTADGTLLPFAPPVSCGCLFDATTTGFATCQLCAGSAGCSGSTPACHYGFCEAR